MFRKNQKNNFIVLFGKRNTVSKKIVPILFIIFSFSWIIYLWKYYFPEWLFVLNIEVFAFVGISLAVFLGFCNNAAYDRFKEGKKQWSNLTVYSRQLTSQILNQVKENAHFTSEDKQVGINIIIAFSYVLNKQLKNKTDWEEIAPFLSKEMYEDMLQTKFKPTFLLNELTSWINELLVNKQIDSVMCERMDYNINKLSEISGACERIVDTKIPFVYFILLHRTVYIYCFILPFGLIDSMVWTMPFFVLFISYTFISLEEVVSQIAEPFGNNEHDLTLDQICKNINCSLLEISEATIVKE